MKKRGKIKNQNGPKIKRLVIIFPLNEKNTVKMEDNYLFLIQN